MYADVVRWYLHRLSKFVSKENTIKCMELMDICRQQLGVISYLIEKFSSNSTLEQVSCNLKDEMMEIYKQYKKEILGE